MVLTTEIKLTVVLPYSKDASEPAHSLTLSSDDGNYSKTLAFPADCQPGDTEGTSVMVFDGLTDGPTYTLHGEGDDDGGKYVVFHPVKYHDMVTTLAGQSDGGSPSAGEDAGGATGTT